VRELPVLLEQRVPYFDPSFEAMIRMQCKFAEEGYEKLSGVQRCVSCSICSSPSSPPPPRLPSHAVGYHIRVRDPAAHRYFSDSIREDSPPDSSTHRVEGVLRKCANFAICGRPRLFPSSVTPPQNTPSADHGAEGLIDLYHHPHACVICSLCNTPLRTQSLLYHPPGALVVQLLV